MIDLPLDERSRLGRALALNMILRFLVSDLAAALRRERAGERDAFFSEEVLEAVLALLDDIEPDPVGARRHYRERLGTPLERLARRQ